jgi:hexulose-6-phosphate isomerase
MRRIAIMQGRLGPPEDGRFQSFPRTRWCEEFEDAAAAGLDAIEWIYDLYGADVNPLATDEGVDQMVRLSSETGTAVASCCADFFMDRPFVKASLKELAELIAKLEWLLSRVRLVGITRLVLPFVDASRIESAAGADRVVAMLEEVLPTAEREGVELHLETAYGPAAFASMLARLPHPLLKANYDSGNSSSLGYEVREELAAYGQRIGSVHIKDRVRGGGTVPLGTGDANLPALIEGLAAFGYQGDFVLQVARGVPGDEVAWARHNRAYLIEQLRAVRGAFA